MGFSNTKNIRVYGYGGHLQPELIQADTDPDDLTEVALLPVDDGYLFHANGLSHWNDGKHILNHYALSAGYFVTEADSPAKLDYAADSLFTAPSDAADTITAFAAGTFYDPQEYAWYPGGRQLYENFDFISKGANTYKLPLPTYARADNPAQLRVRFSASSSTQTTVQTSSTALRSRASTSATWAPSTMPLARSTRSTPFSRPSRKTASASPPLRECMPV